MHAGPILGMLPQLFIFFSLSFSTEMREILVDRGW